MSYRTSGKKKHSFLKILLGIVVIVVALQVFSGGAFFENIRLALQDEEQGAEQDQEQGGPSSSSGEALGEGQQHQNGSQNDQDSQEQDRYPSLPADLQEHILLGPRDQGISATLTGDVLITVVFVNDPTSTWTADRMAQVKALDETTKAAILSEAAAYGADLNITIDYLQGTSSTTEEADRTAWSEQIMASAGLGSVATASQELEKARGVKEAPILFYVDATERSYAMPNSGTATEYAIVWKGIPDATTSRHELYHLFGAVDFYVPEAVAECARRYFPGSIMLEGTGGENADALTAYLVGWTDTLSDQALAFLRETAHITQEQASDELEKETHTGYVENWEKPNGYIITGYLDMGVLEGEGKVIEPNGGWREGYFEYGKLISGRCRIVYEDGGWYEGEYSQGNINGQGTMVWVSGDTYTGQWKNGKYHGTGKATYANGGWSEGSFADSAFVSGRCRIVYDNGGWYEGEYSQGTINGQGTMVWASGDSYTGQWKNAKFHGYGTYTWPSGNSSSGIWENGSFMG